MKGVIKVKCRYCKKELIDGWCTCEKFLVKEKGIEPLVKVTETKGKLGGRNSSSAKIISLTSFNFDKLDVANVEPIKYLSVDDL